MTTFEVNSSGQATQAYSGEEEALADDRTDGDQRVRALLALDFGTYAQCAAVWDRGPTAPGAGRLSAEQLKAADTAAAGQDFESAEDIEWRAGAVWDGADIADRRADVWDAVFHVPPMAQHSVSLVPGKTLAQPDPGQAVIAAYDEGSHLEVFGARGLKRRLLEERPSEKTLDELVSVYLGMHEESIQWITERGGTRRRRPRYVHITYPTRLPAPQKLQLLTTLRATGRFDNLEDGFDEATAVALFDLCARLGQRRELGTAALQARHTGPVPDVPHQDATRPVLTDRVLVVDVGAGTTDVALLDLYVYDDTPPEGGTAPGRYWRFEPTVFASGGALDFGADQLTLSLFATLKKRLAEAGDEWETRFRYHPEQLPDFITLWREAEQAKEALLSADAKPSAAVTVKHHASTAEPTTIDLDFATDLRDSANSFAQRVAVLAVGIADAGLAVIEKRRKSGDGPGEEDADRALTVDRVILAGASFKSPYLTDLVHTHIRTLLRERGRPATYELALHRGYLKEAAALGAAYGGGLEVNFVEPGHQYVLEQLHGGLHFFSVDRLSLRANLPAEFKVDHDAGTFDAFERGQPFDGGSGAENDLRWARSRKPLPIHEAIGIKRFDASPSPDDDDPYSPGAPMTWCNFHFPGWGRLRFEHPELPEEDLENISMTFEVDEHLNFTLFAHHGKALPLDLSAGTVLEQDPACSDTSPLAVDGLAAADVYVNRTGAPEDPATPVIEQGCPLPRAVAIDHTRNGALIQVPAASGDTFRSFEVSSADKWISLGPDGVLRSHPNAPRVQAKDCPDDGEEAEAMVLEFINQPDGEARWALRLEMEPENQYKEQSDPFAGIH